MKRVLLNAALVLACSVGLMGCAGDTAELRSKTDRQAATPPANPSQPPSQTRPARQDLPPLGGSPGAAPCAPGPGAWR